MRLPFLFLAAALSALAAPAADPSKAIDVLNRNCVQCHSQSVSMSGLQLQGREQMLKGGTRGPAVEPGNVEKSLLYQVIAHSGKVQMPPGKKLPEADIATLREWIGAGAPWSDAKAGPNTNLQWWAFRKPVRAPVPPAGEWAKTPIDHFILSKLQEQKLSPAPQTDRLTLIRRATFDLHGLPPTSEQVSAFLQDQSPDAYEKLVDSLLQSPRYGEKWGKHWLDLVRYGDTSGFEQDPYMLYAWRYRDYVIQSFNDDKPYDRFIKEQLAGDEIYPEEPAAQAGTGYFTVGPNRDMLYKVEDVNRVETLTDYVDTTSSVFLGMTVGCARCHDHKFDPIPQRDYYRMQAIFAPAVKTRVFLDYNGARGYDLGENTRTAKLYEIGAELGRILDPWRKKFRDEKLEKLSPEIQEAFRTDEGARTPLQKSLFEANQKAVNPSDDAVRALLPQADAERLHSFEKRLVSMYQRYSPGPFAPGVIDADRTAPVTLMPSKAGDAGQPVNPGFLSALGGGDVPEAPLTATSTGRRKALAEWLANPDHPLTARVMVNRIWQQHFGRGLVATPSDFGTRSPAPSHPELLDWLAVEFMEKGWSVKQLHKLILTSNAYRQNAKPSAEAQAADPENVYLSHFNRRRLEAEEIRDSVLQSAGVLNTKAGGRPVVPPLAKEELYGMSQSADNAWIVTSDPAEHSRRSIYLISRRTFRVPLLEVFDRPEGVLSCSRRDSSTTAPQSLSLLNGDFTMQQARKLSEHLLASNQDPDAIVRGAWQQVLARDPKPEEAAAAKGLLQRQSERLGSLPAAVTELARGLFNINEFLYVE